MSRNLGDAFVRVRPDTSDFGDELGSQLQGSDAAAPVQKSGSAVGHLFGNALKAGALTVTAAAGGILGVALTKGFQRLSAIDQAKAKLEGLGHSTKAVDKIMTNALAAVKGTAYGLDEAATVAASTVAAGIKPGRHLERTLRLVADAATIGGSSMADMGAIFNKVAASNKLQGDTINQLNQQGIPIVQMLTKTLHKSTDQVLELSKKGKISFGDFSRAMKKGLGGAALDSGKTFTGSWKNLMASLSRIGAGLLGGIFPHLAPFIRRVTTAMGPLEDAAGKVGDKIGRALAPALKHAVPWVTHLAKSLKSIDFSKIGSGSSQIGQAFHKVGQALADVDWGKVKDAFGKSAADSISVTGVVVGFLAKHLTLLAKLMPWLVAGFAAFKAAQAAERVLAIASIPTRLLQTLSNLALARSNNALRTAILTQTASQEASTAATAEGTAASIGSRVASLAAAAASKAWAAAQWLLNVALDANPIGLVVIAIAALAAGVVLAWKHSETFRKIVTTAFHAIADAAKWLWYNVLAKVIGFIIDAYAKVYGAIADVLIALGHVPGFGWAKTAGEWLKGAADKAEQFADNIRKIPSNKSVTIDWKQRGVPPPSQLLGASLGVSAGVRVAGGRAGGGPVYAGKRYLVGERGPELLTMGSSSGRITPNGRLAAGGRGGRMRVELDLGEGLKLTGFIRGLVSDEVGQHGAFDDRIGAMYA